MSAGKIPLEFVVLGSGSFTPGRPPAGTGQDGVRNPAGNALCCGDEILLFDLGFGNFRQMVRAGLDPDRVSTVFLTHRHPDHTGDLAALLFYYRYDGKPKGKRLRVCGPRGTAGFVERLAKAHHPWLRPRGYELKLETLVEGSVVRGAGWKVLCREVPHTTESLAYRFESKAGVLCCTGDTSWDPGLARFAAGADLLVSECALADGERGEGHLRVSEALELGRLAQARQVLLTHLSPASARGLDAALRGQRRFRRAEDLMRVKISRY